MSNDMYGTKIGKTRNPVAWQSRGSQYIDSSLGYLCPVTITYLANSPKRKKKPWNFIEDINNSTDTKIERT